MKKSKQSKAELAKEARSLRAFLTEERLVGWFWPHQHARAVEKVRKYDSKWFEKNQHRIIPPEPFQGGEAEEARFKITLDAESELLV